MKEKIKYYLFCLLLILGACNNPTQRHNQTNTTDSDIEITALMEETLTDYDNGKYTQIK